LRTTAVVVRNPRHIGGTATEGRKLTPCKNPSSPLRMFGGEGQRAGTLWQICALVTAAKNGLDLVLYIAENGETRSAIRVIADLAASVLM
jgi:hypothetical protein